MDRDKSTRNLKDKDPRSKSDRMIRHSHGDIVLFRPVTFQLDSAHLVIIDPTSSVPEIIMLTPKVVYGDPVGIF